MNASKIYPIYTVTAHGADGTTYGLTNATIDLMIDEPKSGLANKVTFSLRNAAVGTKKLRDVLSLKMRITVTANDGETKKQVFSGFLWSIKHTGGVEKTLQCIAFDPLIYPQKSKDCMYFSAGKSTHSVCATICEKWGLKLQFAYQSITHPKLPLNNKYISDMLIEVLDASKNQHGKKYVIRFESDVVKILTVGSNTTVYGFARKKSMIGGSSEISLDGVITRVAIAGTADDNDRQPIEATVSGKTSQYGTLQDIITRQTDTTLTEAKAEAGEILKEKGTPKPTYNRTLPDVPWVHKGDKINISDEELNADCIVLSVTHDAKHKTMEVEVEKAA